MIETGFELKNRRLAEIAGMVKKCRCIADVGTDHAHLPIELVLSGKSERAIACDVKKGPLAVAEKNVNALALGDRIELRLGFGLEVLDSGECDCITVAGMGGLMICDILERSPGVARSASQLVLQPNTCEYDLRKYLAENGYVTDDERGVRDGEHYYLIVSCKNAERCDAETVNTEHYTDGGYKFIHPENYYFTGSVMPRRMNGSDREFLENLRNKARRVLEGISLSVCGSECRCDEETILKKQRYEALTEELDSILN